MKIWNPALAALTLFLSSIYVAPLAAQSFVTSAGGFSANDSITFDQLDTGGGFYFFNTPTALVSSNGLGASISDTAGNSYFTRQTPGGNTFANFAPNMALVGSNGGDFTLTFANPVSAVGAYLTAGYYVSFDGSISVNGGGFFTASGTTTAAGDGSALFLGLISNAFDINSVTFRVNYPQSPNTQPNELLLGSVLLAAQVPGVPEPSTWGMMLLGFGAIGFSMRHRRKHGSSQQMA